MKTIYNIGSINIDHVYSVDHFVSPGETLSANNYEIFPGGKGFNQSVALAKAGARVVHGGNIGKEGEWLVTFLNEAGVNTSCIKISDIATGHAIIQVDSTGENAIFLFGGANQSIESQQITDMLRDSEEGDYLLLQNEINNVGLIIKEAKRQKLEIVFNPAPMDENVHRLPLNLVDWLIVNETEGAGLTGEKDQQKIVSGLLERFSTSKIILTLGSRGVIYADAQNQIELPAFKVDAVDTTATGDTFIGYLLASISAGIGIEESLKKACAAAALSASRKGAASSVPDVSEVEQFLNERA